MAFESLRGMKIAANLSNQGFLIGDYFTVYEQGETIPRIHDWDDVSSIVENKNGIQINLRDKQYFIERECVGDGEKYLRLRAIIEGNISSHPDIDYKYTKRILPPKNIYKTCATPDNAFTATGMYTEKEINGGNVILLNTRLGKTLWIIFIVITLFTFGIIWYIFGNLEKNWMYYIPISAFVGLVISLMFYLVIAIIARYRYSELLKVDPALNEQITFIVSNEGFAAVESIIYTTNDLIPWSEANFFIETNSVYIIIKNKRAVFWLPKKNFSKEMQLQLSNFIATKLTQR